MSGAAHDLEAVEALLGQVGLRDEARLRRRLQALSRETDPARRQDALAGWMNDLVVAEARLSARAAAVPEISYPADLPVSQERERIAAAIRDHQVVVVAGETGSGKTTQLPKICLELGRGVRGAIGHTQPRRIAARAVAERIAEELGVELGSAVGYQVRFTDHASDSTLVKLMTDGILLAEIPRDRDLLRYDTLIVDEAHERSLTIDFLLGYLHQLLPRRPDLRLVITSATIDPQRFADHFGGAPVIEVSGRTYPVEIRYRPLEEPPSPDEDDADEPDAPRDQTQGIVDAVEELTREGDGDILVFLSGEREIRDTAEVLEGLDLPLTEVVPLYARLSAAEQHRVFSPHTGRRIVLATNVAETSLTVPGVRYVVDPGTARISRYSNRLKVQRLPIEPVSQASARQRAGRCGRVADGIAIRLYSEADHDARPEFTDPEIRRTSLAAVILRMAALGLGDVSAFPFLDPPDRRQVAAGVQLLEELGALRPATTSSGAGTDLRRRLTPVGRRLSQLPVDPRLGRMLLEADTQGALAEVLVIVAGLSVQDPRERPTEHQGAADAAHRRFADPSSDFLAYLNLWTHLREQQHALSGSAFRRLCRHEYLHYLRVREWQDLHGQLRSACRDLGLTVNTAPAPPDRVHQSLLAGLLSHLGVHQRDKGDYLGARNARFALWPGSSLAKKRPEWVMVAELVETARLWGRVAAVIDPRWAEKLAGDLAKRTYSEPRWDAERGQGVVDERVMLYGVPLVAGRRAALATFDPAMARELFVRHALVQGEWRTHHAFVAANRKAVAEAEEVERRSRRRGLVADDDVRAAFFDARVPAGITSARDFDRWWKKARTETPDLLTYTRELLLPDTGEDDATAGFPGRWRTGDLRLRLSYQFEPGADADGVTVHVPLVVLNQLDPAEFAWQVPGLREELLVALLRSLPKAIRRSFVPAPTFAAALLAQVSPDDGRLLDVVAAALSGMGGPRVAASDFDLAAVPAHLRVTFRIEDERGRRVAEGDDLEALARGLAPALRAEVAAAAGPDAEREGLTTWDAALPSPIPLETERRRGRLVVKAYPALVDEGETVALRLLDRPDLASAAHRRGVRRLLLLAVPSPGKGAVSALPTRTRLALGWNPHGSAAALMADALACATDALMTEHSVQHPEAPVVPRDEAGFVALRGFVLPQLADRLADVLTTTAEILEEAHSIRTRLESLHGDAVAGVADDIAAQLDDLVFPGFLETLGAARLPDVRRYLLAVERRLEVLGQRPGRDRLAMLDVQRLEDDVAAWRAALPPERHDDPEVREVWWSLQELRVSLFANGIRTSGPISEKRIRNAMARLGRS